MNTISICFFLSFCSCTKYVRERQTELVFLLINLSASFFLLLLTKMTTHNSVTQNQNINIVVITGNDETLRNVLSAIQQTHVVRIFKIKKNFIRIFL